MGYGEAKKLLLEKVMSRFMPFKEKRAYLEDHPEEVEKILAKGAEKVRKISRATIQKVREATGLKY